VVPFGFFRNADEGPDGTPGTADDLALPISNMSRLMAVSIFNGQVTNWNQFDPDLNGNSMPGEAAAYPAGDSMPIKVCLRHAGSGTHATLDAGVMRGDYPLVINEILPSNPLVGLGLAAETYFNDGSSDMMDCVGGGGTKSGVIPGYSAVGAVGYADADKVTGPFPEINKKYGDVDTMTWMGEAAEKSNIVNGTYDFWSAQWLYVAPADDTSLVQAFAAYAANPANMPSSRAPYWAAQGEMNVEKATDFTFPKFK
jgi:ABC-type phosphate transport system substrate-binding protein